MATRLKSLDKKFFHYWKELRMSDTRLAKKFDLSLQGVHMLKRELIHHTDLIDYSEKEAGPKVSMKDGSGTAPQRSRKNGGNGSEKDSIGSVYTGLAQETTKVSNDIFSSITGFFSLNKEKTTIKEDKADRDNYSIKMTEKKIRSAVREVRGDLGKEKQNKLREKIRLSVLDARQKAEEKIKKATTEVYKQMEAEERRVEQEADRQVAVTVEYALQGARERVEEKVKKAARLARERLEHVKGQKGEEEKKVPQEDAQRALIEERIKSIEEEQRNIRKEEQYLIKIAREIEDEKIQEIAQDARVRTEEEIQRVAQIVSKEAKENDSIDIDSRIMEVAKKEWKQAEEGIRNSTLQIRSAVEEEIQSIKQNTTETLEKLENERAEEEIKRAAREAWEKMEQEKRGAEREKKKRADEEEQKRRIQQEVQKAEEDTRKEASEELRKVEEETREKAEEEKKRALGRARKIAQEKIEKAEQEAREFTEEEIQETIRKAQEKIQNEIQEHEEVHDTGDNGQPLEHDVLPSNTFGSALEQALFDRALKKLFHFRKEIRCKGILELEQISKKNRAVIRTLYPLLNDKESDVRAQVLKSLTHLEERESVPKFVTFLNDRNVRVRLAALRGLYKLEGGVASGYFVRALRDESNEIREVAAIYLARASGISAVPELIELLNRNQDDSVRKASLQSMSIVKDKSSIPCLIGILNDSNIELRRIAVNMLQDWTGKTFEFNARDSYEKRKPSIEKFEQWWKQNKEKFVFKKRDYRQNEYRVSAQQATVEKEKERAERETRAKAEREAKDKAERETKAKAERETKAEAEREAKDRVERETKAKAEREAKDKTEEKQINKTKKKVEKKTQQIKQKPTSSLKTSPKKKTGKKTEKSVPKRIKKTNKPGTRRLDSDALF